MSAWVNNDEGPECFCGNPTVVKTDFKKYAVLLCLFHTREAGSIFALPPEKPDWWPNPPSPETLLEFMRSAPTAIFEEDDE